MKPVTMLFNRALITGVLLTSTLLAACIQEPLATGTSLPPVESEPVQTTEPAPVLSPAATEAPVSTETPAAETQAVTEAPAATETEPPALTPSPTFADVIEGPVIEPENAPDLQQISGISLSGARLFTWLVDSQSLAVASEADLVFYSLNPLQETGRIPAPGATLLAASADGSILAWVGEDNSLHLVDVAQQSEMHSTGERDASITSLAFSPDGQTLAAASSDNRIELFDVASGEVASTWELPYWLSNLSFSPDGSALAGADLPNFAVHILALPDGVEQSTLTWTEHASPALYSVHITPSWETVAWVARGTVQLMQMSTGELGPVLSHEDFVSAASISPDSGLLATAAAATVGDEFSPVVILWDISTGEQVNVLVQPEPVTSLAFSPDSRTLAILGAENVLRLWGVAE